MNWVFIVAAIQASMIFLFAAIGELIDQRSGILNVGLEGLMLVGALGAFIVAGETGTPGLVCSRNRLGSNLRPPPWVSLHYTSG